MTVVLVCLMWKLGVAGVTVAEMKAVDVYHVIEGEYDDKGDSGMAESCVCGALGTGLEIGLAPPDNQGG